MAESEARFHDQKGPKTADKIVSPSSVSILQDFLIAIAQESESNLGCGVADPQEGILLVGSVPAERAIRAEAAVALLLCVRQPLRVSCLELLLALPSTLPAQTNVQVHCCA